MVKAASPHASATSCTGDGGDASPGRSGEGEQVPEATLHARPAPRLPHNTSPGERLRHGSVYEVHTMR
jgi:hypothetical protein